MKNFFKKQNINIIKVIISLLIVIILLIVTGFFSGEGKKLIDYIEIKTFLAIVLFFVVDSVSFFIISFFSKKFEDSKKLTQNYKHIIKNVYPLENFYRFTNYNSEEIVFPNTILYEKELKDMTFILFNDRQEQFQPPDFSKSNYYELFSAHRYSNKQNKILFRLDDISFSDDTVNLITSRTTSYDGLVTNRCMDYKVNDLSVRELYDCGHFLTPLSKSKMSNHAGYIAILETSDNYVLLYYKGKKTETYKATLGPTITNTINALDIKNQLSIDNMEKCIKDNINKRIEKNVVDDFTLGKNTIAMARNAIEGGTAQFVFYHQSNLSLKEIYGVNTLKEVLKITYNKKALLAIKKEKLINAQINVDYLMVDNKKYKSSPQAMFAIALYINQKKKNN